METLLEWADKYSAPVLLMLCVGAALVFLLKLVTERTIEAEFSRLAKQLDLKLERRSEFEQQVLLERYRLVCDFASRLSRITTDLNRVKSGQDVKDLFHANELVPLTTVYEDLASKSFQLSTPFHQFFIQHAGKILNIANAQTPAERETATTAYANNLAHLNVLVNEEFKTSGVSW